MCDSRNVWVSKNPPQPFEYSDGSDVESYIRETVARAKDLSVLSREIRRAAVDWPSSYHFSPRRANLLRPLSISQGSRVLEIGSGCGALTRQLVEAGAHVTAIEGSVDRAHIVASRLRDRLGDVTVIAGSLEDIYLTGPFDMVVLVGVLEYAAVHSTSDSSDPYLDLLSTCSGLLAEGGILVLAIENKLGQKYLAGLPEDHTGLQYQGINNSYTATGPRTFGLGELRRLLDVSGLPCQRVLTPVPDYKLVRAVIDFESLSKEELDAANHIATAAIHEDFQLRGTPPFSLEALSSGVILNGFGDELGNSFLVLAGNTSEAVESATESGVSIWHYASDRLSRFSKVTKIGSTSEPTAGVKRELLKPTRKRSGNFSD